MEYVGKENVQHCGGTARTQPEKLNVEEFHFKRNNSQTVQNIKKDNSWFHYIRVYTI